ncbi:hypothetical protein [Hymenobacter weizhouensis]|uniref:hypothetical protein n=1 Tax=Hymenobacter sp. YIM 151500-1 TaxID=2987689 RepID=UPI0022276B75|nr:hypothetical protein [Hymenobacter sp. YIM 151500-1]UYZ64892.1 hypothetical protein OIS53_08580 [Hymenobacter sp. YIM 151500-1]
MKYFLPDEESLREIFGAYMDKGLRFEMKPDSYFGCYALKVRFAEGSNASPVLPLYPDKMQTPEAAQQWLEHLRDEQLAMITRGLVG